MVSSSKTEKNNLESIKAKLDATFKLTEELINEDPKEKLWKSYHNEPTLQAFTRNDKATKLDIIKSKILLFNITLIKAIGILNAATQDAVDLLMFDT